MKKFNQTEPPADLERQILAKITVLSLKRARRRLFAWLSIAVLSLVGLVYAMVLVWQNLSASGWLQYWQLAWSDQSILWTYGQEFIWSLTESLPLLTLDLVLAVTGLLLWSVLKILENNRHYGFKKLASI